MMSLSLVEVRPARLLLRCWLLAAIPSCWSSVKNCRGYMLANRSSLLQMKSLTDWE